MSISKSESAALRALAHEPAVGIVAEVSSSRLAVQFGVSVGANGHAGKHQVSVPEVGAYLAVACGDYAVFSQLSKVEVAPGATSVQTVLIGDVRMLATIDMRNGDVSQGVLASPHLGDQVFLAPSELTKLVVEGRVHREFGGNSLLMQFARLADGTPLSFSPEMIFGRHCAILGSSGGGKSWTIARVLEEAARFHSKVILFDATGEFYRLKRGVRHAFMGEDDDPNPDAQQVVLPYYQLTERALFCIFKPTPETQAPKLRAAIKSLKLAAADQSLAPDGTIVKVHKPKKPFDQALESHAEQVNHPFAEWDIRKLARQVEHECVHAQRSAQEAHVWGDINGQERADCTPLITRIQDLIRSANLAPIFAPGNRRSIFREISSFIRDEDSRVLRISMKSLSFAHHARELVANAAGRFLLEVAREGRFREQPVLVVVDEAHQFLNKALQSDDEVYPLDSFALIAKEGRKYSLNICIATQRPRDIPEGVLSQIGTLLVHRLINDQDRVVIERASGSIDRTSLNQLPALVPGEALIVGIDFPIPLTVKIMRPDCEPDSRGPDYQKFWRQRA